MLRSTFTSEEEAVSYFRNETAIIVKDNSVYILVKFGRKYEVQSKIHRSSKEAKELSEQKVIAGNSEKPLYFYFNKYAGIVNNDKGEEKMLNIYNFVEKMDTKNPDRYKIDTLLLQLFGPSYTIFMSWLSCKLKDIPVPDIYINEHDSVLDMILSSVFQEQYVYLKKEEHINMEMKEIVDRRIIMMDSSLPKPCVYNELTQHIESHRGYIFIKDIPESFKIRDAEKTTLSSDDINHFRNKLLSMENKFVDINVIYFLSKAEELQNYQIATVHNAYKDWCLENKLEPITPTKLAMVLNQVSESQRKRIDGTEVTLYLIHKKVLL
jgi:hypothetical protein